MHALLSIWFLESNKIKYNKQKLIFLPVLFPEGINRCGVGDKPKDALADGTEIPSARVFFGKGSFGPKPPGKPEVSANEKL
jgi:hypothetical protein